MSAIAREEAALERSLLIGVVAFSVASIAWASTALVIDLVNQPGDGRPDPSSSTLAYPVVAVTIVGLAIAYTTWSASQVARRSAALLRPLALAVHGTIALALVLLDVWAYGPNNSHSQSLGSVWPLSWVFVMGLAYAGWGGFGAGVAVGVASLVGQLAFRPAIDQWSGDAQVGAIGTIVLYAIGGAVVGFAAVKLREAERQIALARARDEIARTLHDGVLQTLAVIQRRSDDDELVQLARHQESELRDFLFGMRPDRVTNARAFSGDDLLTTLRHAGALAEQRHTELRVEVVCIVEPSRMKPAVIDAVGGAVAEALANAANHGMAKHVVVCVDEDDDGRLFCSVKDDGQGFDPNTITEGEGLARSVRGRIAEVGGEIIIAAQPGRGAEVQIRV